MYDAVLRDPAFFRFLLRIDEDLAHKTRERRCRHCGGPLHAGDFPRKPRGCPSAVREEYSWRFSFTCGHCDQRATADSVRFLGRKVYLGAIVVLISAMRSGPSPTRMRRLHELVGVSRHTVSRWRKWWSEVLPGSRFWAGACAALIPPVAVADLPSSLLERFGGSPEERLTALLRWLSPLSGGSPADHAP